MNGFWYFFGRNVTDKVSNQKTFTMPHQTTCASALPGKMGKCKNACCMSCVCVQHRARAALSTHNWKTERAMEHLISWNSADTLDTFLHGQLLIQHNNWRVACHTDTDSLFVGFHSQSNYWFVFQELPEPNRAWLLGVYVVAPRPLLSLYGIIYVTWYARHLPKPTGVRFR